MKILVTGKNGQVGNELNQISSESVHEIICLSHAELDICDIKNVRNILIAEKPDIVINTAAYTSVDLAEQEQDKAFNVNSYSLEHIAKVCDEIEAVLIHLSTDYVFSGLKNSPYTETDKVSPINTYGLSKLKGEIFVKKYCSKHIIIRTSWVFSSHGSNFLKTMMKLFLDNDSVNVVSDQLGAPTSAKGISYALLSIIEKISKGKAEWGIYNYCGSPYVSWHEFAELIFNEAYNRKIISHKINIKKTKSKDFKAPAKRPVNSRLNCDKIKEVYGIKPDNWSHQINKALDNLY